MTYSFDPAAAGVGTHTITYSFTDPSGCFNSASDDVEVFSIPAVTFTAPADLCINAGVQAGLGGGSPTGGVYSGNGVTDDGNGQTYSFDPAAAGVGDHTITYTATISGCSNSENGSVNVSSGPVASCRSVFELFLDASGNGTLSISDIDESVANGCGIASRSLSKTSFDCSNVGANTVTLTVTDNNGNTSTCSSSVVVLDHVSPTAVLKDITVSLDASGNASIEGTDVDNGSSDACGIGSFDVLPNTFDCSAVSYTHLRAHET